MLRPTPFFHRKFELLVTSLAISMVSAGRCVRVQAGIGTEILANREIIEVTRSGSPFERSLVPMSCANRRCTRVVYALPQRMPQTETRWRREVDSNYRCRFLNCQTTAFRRGLHQSDESRGRLGIGRFGKSLDPGAPFDADMRNFAPSPCGHFSSASSRRSSAS